VGVIIKAKPEKEKEREKKLSWKKELGVEVLLGL